MILDELMVHNFGVYGGRQAILLTPTPDRRPITLFGGLNGGGKTTLLDALQLCLYGVGARCSNRQSLPYDEFLRRSIHRGAVEKEAAIELAFRHTSNGVEQSLRLHRSWRSTASGCRERFHVLRNGELDALATEHWGEQVEDFIPARIAHLFLFDGEKVESYADLDGASTLIATAIQNLLGLDIVERLTADLGVLERRKRTSIAPTDADRTVEDLHAQIAELEKNRRTKVQERAAAQNDMDRHQSELDDIEARYRREGGALYEQRAKLESDLSTTGRTRETALRQLRDLTAGSAPFLMVVDLLHAVAERASQEYLVHRRRESGAAILEEHAAILALPAMADLSANQRAMLESALSDRRLLFDSNDVAPSVLDLSAEARSLLDTLVNHDLSAMHGDLDEALLVHDQVEEAYNQAADAAAAVPTEDMVAAIFSERDRVRQVVEQRQSEQRARDEEISRIDRELSQLSERATRLAEASARRQFEQEDMQRIMHHSTKVRATLSRFREAVIVRHVTRIERLVFESFQQLIRKRQLVTSLKIDPVTFALELRGPDGRSMTPERLSAGERQLLAIAILWGLAKSSGRPLPTVIDTPLGRLDSVHRNYLVKRYFPNASHQVLLLSTDEEIAGPYYDALKPSIGRSYALRFDESEGRTIVEPGYLNDGDRAHAH